MCGVNWGSRNGINVDLARAIRSVRRADGLPMTIRLEIEDESK